MQLRDILTDFSCHRIRSEFDAARPFRYAVIDDFFHPGVAERLEADFPAFDDERWFHHRTKIAGRDNPFEKGMSAISKPERMPDFHRTVLAQVNSRAFCRLLDRLTGIGGLQPDHHWHYSGLRVMVDGASQFIHSDARIHPNLGIEKKITLMMYLCRDWREEYGGHLEIWNDEMTSCVDRILPAFNRAVVFECTERSYHGVPRVTSGGRHRKSLTLSFLLDSKTDETRPRALFVLRPEDRDNPVLRRLAEERARLNDTT